MKPEKNKRGTKSSAFSRRLIELIDTDGRTDREIAAQAGVSAQYLSDIRNHTRGHLMPVPVAVGILRALGLSATAAGRTLYDCHPETRSNESPENTQVV